jgi:hypothetical protein
VRPETFDARDFGSKFRRQQSVVSRFDHGLPDRRDSDIDINREDIGPSPRVSSAMRQAVTIALLNPIGRGSSVDQAMKASWL